MSISSQLPLSWYSNIIRSSKISGELLWLFCGSSSVYPWGLNIRFWNYSKLPEYALWTQDSESSTGVFHSSKYVQSLIANSLLKSNFPTALPSWPLALSDLLLGPWAEVSDPPFLETCKHLRCSRVETMQHLIPVFLNGAWIILGNDRVRLPPSETLDDTCEHFLNHGHA